MFKLVLKELDKKNVIILEFFRLSMLLMFTIFSFLLTQFDKQNDVAFNLSYYY